MENREYLIELYEEYRKLLTNKQQSYFESYYYEDLSLNEIADLNKVTKTLEGKTNKNLEEKLLNYEQILKIHEKNELIKQLINETDEKTKNKLEEILYK